MADTAFLSSEASHLLSSWYGLSKTVLDKMHQYANGSDFREYGSLTKQRALDITISNKLIEEPVLSAWRVISDISNSDQPQKLSDLFLSWRSGENDIPSMPLLIGHAIDHMGIGLSESDRELLMCAAFLSEADNDNPYHNRPHSREVAICFLIMVMRNRMLRDLSEKFYLKDRQVLVSLATSLIHDLAHDGRSYANRFDSLLEIQSVDAFAQFAKLFDVHNKDLEDIYIINYTTDVASGGFKDSPAQRLHEIYNGNIMPVDRINHRLMYLERHPALCHSARMLGGADLTPSAGLSRQMNLLMSALVSKEMGGDAVARVGAIRFFFDNICGAEPFDIKEADRFASVYRKLSIANREANRMGLTYLSHA